MAERKLTRKEKQQTEQKMCYASGECWMKLCRWVFEQNTDCRDVQKSNGRKCRFQVHRTLVGGVRCARVWISGMSSKAANPAEKKEKQIQHWMRRWDLTNGIQVWLVIQLSINCDIDFFFGILFILLSVAVGFDGVVRLWISPHTMFHSAFLFGWLLFLYRALHNHTESYDFSLSSFLVRSSYHLTFVMAIKHARHFSKY